MGQEYSVARLVPPQNINIPELSDFELGNSLGPGKLFKSVCARNVEGVVVIKMAVKPSQAFPMHKYRDRVIAESRKLSDVPNALPIRRVILKDDCGYLVRQYMHQSLYDRISTRPFLDDIEKKWLAFQMICALRDCHAKNVFHGDIKTENVLVTSWNWLYLCDFASWCKPATLPDDNPSNFSFFFDTSSRRTCYIAPERFVSSASPGASLKSVDWAMDIFSVGCVLAELFLETPIFTLHQLFQYRKGEYNPAESQLSRVQDKHVSEMISTMIRLDPEKRYSADQYLKIYKGKVFPEYFYSFLHQYMAVANDPLPNHKTPYSIPDERIERVFNDFEKIAFFLDYPKVNEPVHDDGITSPRLGLESLPVRLSIPNMGRTVVTMPPPQENDGTLIFVDLIVSSLRNVSRATSKLRAFDLLLAFSERLTDEAKLDCVLPNLVAALGDPVDVVVMAAVRSIAQLVRLVERPTPINAEVFSHYLLPRLNFAVQGLTPTNPSKLVRSTYASCIGSLALTAERFRLETLVNNPRASFSIFPSDPDPDPSVLGPETIAEEARTELVNLFEVHTKALVEDSDPQVRRAFLGSVPDLCVFFGLPAAYEIIVTHLNTYLNDRDSTLRCAFLDAVVGIGTFIGPAGFQHFILPLMVQALTDPEEHVVDSALASLTELAALGILGRDTALELAEVALARFLMHPNAWIRASAAAFLSAAAESFPFAVRNLILLPKVEHYFTDPQLVVSFDEMVILDHLKKPLSRKVFDEAVAWAQASQDSLVWKPFQKLRGQSFADPVADAALQAELNAKFFDRISKNKEDEVWINKLRKLGMSRDDEFKLLGLRDYIWRLIHTRPRGYLTTPAAANALGVGEKVKLVDHNAKIITVLFEESEVATALEVAQRSVDTGQALTLEAALQEASAATEVLRGARGNDANRQALASNSLSQGSAEVADHKHVVRKASAVNLLSRHECVKTGPELSTTQTNAQGVVGGPAPITLVGGTEPPLSGGNKRKALHNYDGHDPDVRNMLTNMFVANFPYNDIEFGPPVKQNWRSRSKTSAASRERWRPLGTSVATAGEHQGAINRIVVAPDHMFFLTAGDDGCVKVWDTMRLDKNSAYRSRQTHRHETRVIALCFVEQTHSFVSCAVDGSIHVVKVDCVDADVVRYRRLKVLRQCQLPKDEYAVWCEHFNGTSGKSMLVLATNMCRVLIIDLRDMSTSHDLRNPEHHGRPTCFCIDEKRNWLLLGTQHGVLDLWDLRVQIRCNSWGVPGQQPIYRLAPHPIKVRRNWVLCAGGTGQGEVTAWDIEKGITREVYRVAGPVGDPTVAGGGGAAGTKDFPFKAEMYQSWKVDDNRQNLLKSFALRDQQQVEKASRDKGVRAMVVGYTTDGGEHGRDYRQPYIITGGSDKKLRFWDVTQIAKSHVFSGLSHDEGQMGYTQHSLGTIDLNLERAPRTTGANSADATVNATQSKKKTSAGTIHDQPLLQAHLDFITDVAVIEVPYNLVISVDRSGTLFAFT